MSGRVGVLVVVLFGTMLWFGWATSEHGLCSVSASNKLKLNEALNCFEFWFYRYQTLLTGFIALVAAGVAWSIGQLQIKVASDGVREARRSRAADIAERLIPRLTSLSECEEIFREINSVFFEIAPVTATRSVDRLSLVSDERRTAAAKMKKLMMALKDRAGCIPEIGDQVGVYVWGVNTLVDDFEALIERPGRPFKALTTRPDVDMFNVRYEEDAELDRISATSRHLRYRHNYEKQRDGLRSIEEIVRGERNRIDVEYCKARDEAKLETD